MRGAAAAAGYRPNQAGRNFRLMEFPTDTMAIDFINTPNAVNEDKIVK